MCDDAAWAQATMIRIDDSGEPHYVRLLHRGHTFNQYVIRAPRRDELRQHLSDRGIGCAVYYPLPLHLQPCFAGLGHGEGDFPVAEQASREVLALPVFPELSPDEIEEVVGAVAEFYSS